MRKNGKNLSTQGSFIMKNNNRETMKHNEINSELVGLYSWESQLWYLNCKILYTVQITRTSIASHRVSLVCVWLLYSKFGSTKSCWLGILFWVGLLTKHRKQSPSADTEHIICNVHKNNLYAFWVRGQRKGIDSHWTQCMQTSSRSYATRDHRICWNPTQGTDQPLTYYKSCRQSSH